MDKIELIAIQSFEIDRQDGLWPADLDWQELPDEQAIDYFDEAELFVNLYPKQTDLCAACKKFTFCNFFRDENCHAAMQDSEIAGEFCGMAIALNADSPEGKSNG